MAFESPVFLSACLVSVLMLFSCIVAIPGYFIMAGNFKRVDVPTPEMGVLSVSLRIIPIAFRMAATLIICGFWYSCFTCFQVRRVLIASIG